MTLMTREDNRMGTWASFAVAVFSLGVAASVDPFGAQRLDRVLKLPGQNFDVTFAHYSGYVTVNDESERALFYWFFEALEDPASKPLVLWLNGGPGSSSIGYGEAAEIGPFHINPDLTLYLNPYSWNQVANVLFIDSPVGVGFSYSNTSSDLQSNGDKRTAQDNLAFLLRWFERFPQYKGRDFYLTGESYAGHYVPQLSQEILGHNSNGNGDSINLKGYLVGNPLFDDHNDRRGVFEYMWTSGLISDQTYTALKLLCSFQSFVHPSKSCSDAMNKAHQEFGDIDPYSIFTPRCHSTSQQMSGRFSEGYEADPCTRNHSLVYFNLPEVQKALHVDPNHAPSHWDTANSAVLTSWKDSAPSVLDVLLETIRAGLRIWVFSGDTDTVIPVPSTRYNIQALNLTTVTPWRAWYDGVEVGGWTEEYEGVRLVTVRGGGHEVPLHKPKRALTLFTAFLAGSHTLQTLTDSSPSSISFARS